ncbi:hypothetical protein SprV_0100383200 [Sparganum proliferum]
MPINTTHSPDIPANTNTISVNTSDEDPVYTCPHCNCTFTLHIGLVSHLRINRTETGEPVPGAPAYTRRIRLHCPHYPHTVMHSTGLFDHMPIHESGINRSPDKPSTSSAPNMPSPAHALPSGAPTSTSSITFRTSCPPTMLSPNHTPSPSAPINTSSTSTITQADTDTADFLFPHYPRTSTPRIGLVGHLRVHRNGTGKPVSEAPVKLAASTSTIHIILTHLFTACVYRATCAFMKTCDRQLPQTPNRHLPRKWEVCASAPSPRRSLAAFVIGA